MTYSRNYMGSNSVGMVQPQAATPAATPSGQPLAGLKALVTGGTAGIGRGIAEELRWAGATVAVTGLGADEVAECQAAGYVAFQADLSVAESCHAAVADTVVELGGLDIVVANAGIYPQATLESLTFESWEQIFRVNVAGTMFVVQAAAPYLAESNCGRVIVTSSITGNLTGYPGWSHYGATKAAQMGFVRSAAVELAPKGITVNAVLPGNIVTPSLRANGEAYLEEMVAAVPLGFLGEPQDIGAAVAFLASPAARYITGQGIVIDGGQVLPEG